MHIIILFHNIGGYHAARLRAAQSGFLQKDWQLTVVQETDNAQEHPWGDLAKEITFPLKTLLPAKDVHSIKDCHPQSTAAASRLSKCLDQLKPDILIVPGWGYPTARAASKWARQHHIPTILMSESKWNDVPRAWWKERLKSLLYVRQFKAALVGGGLHFDYLAELGFPQEGIFMGYDVVDNDYFTDQSQLARQDSLKTRQQHPQIPGRQYFITVTRFIPRKNVLRLIDAYAQYREKLALENPWDLVICGSGVEEDNIRSRIAQYKLQESVHLPGFKSYREIPKWFGLASSFIHPALSEQWGLVVNEALASGLPVLVSNRCGCFPELVHEGANGFGFDPEDVDQLASLMKKMSKETVDKDSMSHFALNHIQNFSPVTFGNGLKQAVEYALSS